MALNLGILFGLMASGDPVPPAADKPLTIDGVAHGVEHAELSLRVETETWDGASQTHIYGRNPSAVLALEVRVAGGSGDGGALSRDLYFHLPKDAPAALKGFVFDQKDHQVEAWCGNDAPELENNRLEIGSDLGASTVLVHWTASTEQGSTLEFHGSVEFMGISLKVKKVTDAEGFLRKVWPALDPVSLELASESEIDFGDDYDEDRQHWMELHYDFKPMT